MRDRRHENSKHESRASIKYYYSLTSTYLCLRVCPSELVRILCQHPPSWYLVLHSSLARGWAAGQSAKDYQINQLGLHLTPRVLLNYTCQLFLRCKREIFILAVPGILNTTRSFPKIPNEFRSLPKTSEDFRSLPKSQHAYKRGLAPSAFPFKNQRSRGRYCPLFNLYMVFVPYMGLS